MNNLKIFLLLITVLIVNSCSKDSNNALSPDEFAKKIQQTSNAVVVDVRTPEEYNSGHIQNAKNIDWNGSDFETIINTIDKTKPIFVYCLSGGRSANAVQKMRSIGFKNVYELDGGIMKWRANNLPIEGEKAEASGMTKKAFDELLASDKYILVDFYADWCGPCQKMKPSLDEISKEMADKVTVIRIDTDANQELAEELNIEALPTLLLYKNKTNVWSNIGLIDKQTIVQQLK